MTDEELNILEDIKEIENSKMFINEKKYYLKLIDNLKNIGYYKTSSTYKQIWRK